MEARAEAVVVDGSMLLDCSPAAARLRAPPAAVAVDASRPALRASELYGRAFLGRRFGDVAVARGAVAGAVRDAVFAASTRRSLTLFPGAPGQRTFSQTHHRALGAALRPSAAAWAWLARSAEPWQLRGALDLDARELGATCGALLGRRDGLEVLGSVLPGAATSLWAGSAGTRTPLHADAATSVVVQLAGAKVFRCCSRDDVAAADLPPAVLRDGDAAAALGLAVADVERIPNVATVVLEPGDALVLPRGVYHDVEARDGLAASLVLRVDCCADPAAAAAAAAARCGAEAAAAAAADAARHLEAGDAAAAHFALLQALAAEDAGLEAAGGDPVDLGIDD